MILVDANLLVYAYVRGVSQHVAARKWLDAEINGPGRVGLPWPSLLAFLRLVTNARVFSRPASSKQAWGQVRSWLRNDNVWIPQPTDRHADLLEGLLLPDVQANLIPDADLAVLALEHGLTLCSTDGDFARFRGLRWRNPLAEHD